MTCSCGSPIPEARLKAVETELCVKCQDRLERKGKIPRVSAAAYAEALAVPGDEIGFD